MEVVHKNQSNLNVTRCTHRWLMRLGHEPLRSATARAAAATRASWLGWPVRWCADLALCQNSATNRAHCRLVDLRDEFPKGLLFSSIDFNWAVSKSNSRFDVPGMRDGAGGGGMFGGPPLDSRGIGCCCKGCVRTSPASLGSTSSHSPAKSPELNLFDLHIMDFRE